VSTAVLILVLHCFSMFDAWCYNRTICLYMCIYSFCIRICTYVSTWI